MRSTVEIDALMEKLGPQLDGLPMAVCIPALTSMLLMALADEARQSGRTRIELVADVERIIRAMRQAVAGFTDQQGA